METCGSCGGACIFAQIHWLWYALSVVAVITLGAFWYSFKCFGKKWVEANNIQLPEKGDKAGMIIPLIIQIIATALMSLAFFVLLNTSGWCVAILTAIAFLAWQKASIKFRIASMKKYIVAASIDVVYLMLSIAIMLLFASIGAHTCCGSC